MKKTKDVVLQRHLVSVGVFNYWCYQTSGPSSSSSWRSSIMNVCSPTSPTCRRTGVLHAHLFLPSIKSNQKPECNSVIYWEKGRVCEFSLCVLHVFSESQWREQKNAESSLPTETDGISQKHIETLSQICRTHLRYTTTHQHNIYHRKSGHSVVLSTCSTLLKQTDAWEENHYKQFSLSTRFLLCYFLPLPVALGQKPFSAHFALL